MHVVDSGLNNGSQETYLFLNPLAIQSVWHIIAGQILGVDNEQCLQLAVQFCDGGGFGAVPICIN